MQAAWPFGLVPAISFSWPCSPLPSPPLCIPAVPRRGGPTLSNGGHGSSRTQDHRIFSDPIPACSRWKDSRVSSLLRCNPILETPLSRGWLDSPSNAVSSLVIKGTWSCHVSLNLTNQLGLSRTLFVTYSALCTRLSPSTSRVNRCRTYIALSVHTRHCAQSPNVRMCLKVGMRAIWNGEMGRHQDFVLPPSRSAQPSW